MVDQSSTELIIVKDGEKYIRFLSEGFEYCSLNKASVFPMDSLSEVQKRCRTIASKTEKLQLMKLVIREEPLTE